MELGVAERREEKRRVLREHLAARLQEPVPRLAVVHSPWPPGTAVLDRVPDRENRNIRLLLFGLP